MGGKGTGTPRPGNGGARPGNGRKTGFNALSSSYARAIIDSIETKKLITRLTNHAMGELKKPMDASQVAAAKIILDKALSNAPTRTEHSGVDGADIPVAIKVVFTNAA